MALYDEFDRQPNRLITAQSAYLRAAAYQPVGWYEFTPEAFAEARRQEKPVLLDIGAAWCHWCHVIDRESYENPEIATLINELFIPVKVDRDERPDIDARYQTAVQLLTGHGGWPLTVFLDADGVPFYGGTYFPPDDVEDRVGMKTLLPRLAHAYKYRRHELNEVARSLDERIAATRADGLHRAPLTGDVVAAIARSVRARFNADQGGFEPGGPKFPHPAVIEFALMEYDRTGVDYWRLIVEKTLREMAWGGIHDHLGGGWHRYSVDAHWTVPHFEKLASDNALILENLVHAARAFDDPLLRAAADDTLAFILTDLTDHERGGFYASQDADYSLADDGDYWTWSEAQFLLALPPDEVHVLGRYFGVTPAGDMHGGRNVLRVRRTPPEVARDLELPLEQVEACITAGMHALRQARALRKTPKIDRSKYASWNALLISALLEAGALFGRDDALSVALVAADTLLRDAYDPDQGIYHRFHADDGARLPGLLEDQAYAARAFLDAFAAGGQPAHLQAARRLLDLCLEQYHDASGGFLDVAANRPPAEAPYLTPRRAVIDDQPTPAPNAVLALTLDRMWLLTHEERYRDAARGVLEAFAGTAPQYGLFAAMYGLTATYHAHPPVTAVIVGDLDDDATQALWQAARATYRPGRLAVVFAPDADPPYPPRETPVAYVCAGETCSEPVTHPDALRRVLREFDRPSSARGDVAA